MNPITEIEMRTYMRDLLQSRAEATGGRLYEELGVEHGGARVDFAIVSGALEAYELKSDFDNLARMHNQIHAYNRVFDSITLVTAPSQSTSVAAIAPSWWGLVELRRGPLGLETSTTRPAKPNPLQQAESLATLLWRAEASAALEESSGAQISAKLNKAQLYRELAENFTLDRIRQVVAESLLARDYSILAVNAK